MKIGIIGGGAAGIFSAIIAAENHSGIEITVLEKTSALLSKVKISGGGRCNVTNSETDISEFIKNYPRGEKELRQVFSHFGNTDTISWLESHGLPLISEDDGRVFPKANTSQAVINLFMTLIERYKIKIIFNFSVKDIVSSDEGFKVTSGTDTLYFDKIIIASGGFNSEEKYSFLKNLSHTIIKPVPSLFTFNIDDKSLTALSGISKTNVLIKINEYKINSKGDILITHFGLSGPVILKLSAFAARELAVKNYNFELVICWDIKMLRIPIEVMKETNYYKLIINTPPESFPSRLWQMLVIKSGIKETKRWNEISRKEMNNLADTIFYDKYIVNGKNTFKEEFVTAGGIDRKEIDFRTMESKILKNLYFAGEIIDIDGVTGGFNFQSAWSTAYIAAKSL